MQKNKKLFSVIIPILSIILLLIINHFLIQRKVTADFITLRSTNSTNSEIVSLLYKDEPITILQKKDDWYYIQHHNQYFYTSTKELDTNESIQQPAIISQSSVNIFKNKELTEIYKTVTNGTKVPLLYKNDTFAQIIMDNHLFWVNANNISTQETSNTLTTSSQVINGTTWVTTEQFPQTEILKVKNTANLKTKPSAASSTLQKFGQNAFLYYLNSSENNFYYAKTTEGTEGYVSANEVEKTNAMQRIGVNSKTLNGSTITIDPGHGGQDGGSAVDNVKESAVALSTSNLIKEKLEKLGAKVILTRTDDKFVSLSDRPLIAQQQNSDVFISIHYDSSDVANKYSGTSVHMLHFEDSLLAFLMNEQLKNLPLPNNGIKNSNYQVLRQNTLPSILLELGYMNNDNDRQTFNTTDYQNKVADAVVAALENYFLYAQ